MDLSEVAHKLKEKLALAISQRKQDKIEQYVDALGNLSLPASVVSHADLGRLVNAIRTDKCEPSQ